MAEHGHDDAHHAAEDERMSRELTADRERMFDMFVKIAAWNLVLIFIVLAFLALTQT